MLERGAGLRFFALFSASHTFIERKQTPRQLDGVCPEGEGVIITSALLHMLTFNRVGISKPNKTPANTHTYTHIRLTLTSLGHRITHTSTHTHAHTAFPRLSFYTESCNILASFVCLWSGETIKSRLSGQQQAWALINLSAEWSLTVKVIGLLSLWLWCSRVNCHGNATCCWSECCW